MAIGLLHPHHGRGPNFQWHGLRIFLIVKTTHFYSMFMDTYQKTSQSIHKMGRPGICSWCFCGLIVFECFWPTSKIFFGSKKRMNPSESFPQFLGSCPQLSHGWKGQLRTTSGWLLGLFPPKHAGGDINQRSQTEYFFVVSYLFIWLCVIVCWTMLNIIYWYHLYLFILAILV